MFGGCKLALHFLISRRNQFEPYAMHISLRGLTPPRMYQSPNCVAKMVCFVYERDSHDFHPIRSTIVDYVNLVAGRYAYWNHSLGVDHFMLSCHVLFCNRVRDASFSSPEQLNWSPMQCKYLGCINLQTGSTAIYGTNLLWA